MKKRRPKHAATCSHLHGSVRHVVLLNQAFVHRVATTGNTGGFGTCTSHNQPPHPHPNHAFDCCLQLKQPSPSATITNVTSPPAKSQSKPPYRVISNRWETVRLIREARPPGGIKEANKWSVSAHRFTLPNAFVL